MKEARQAGSRAWIIAALFGIAAALGFTDVYVIRAALNVPVPAQLGISGTQSGSELLFQWNPGAPPLAGAENADVVIDDGSHSTQLVLLPAQIAGGSIQYSPYGKEVGFRLIAHASDGRAALESIRVVGNPTMASTPPAHDPGTVTIRVAPAR